MNLHQRVVTVVVCLAIAGATSACSSSPSATPTTTAPTTVPKAPITPPPPIVANDPAKPIAATLGQTFKIRVDLNPTKEARWQVESYDQSIVFFLGEGPDPDNTAPGAPLTNVLTFRADKAGSSQIVLRFGVEGPGSPSDKRVTFTANVT